MRSLIVSSFRTNLVRFKIYKNKMGINHKMLAKIEKTFNRNNYFVLLKLSLDIPFSSGGSTKSHFLLAADDQF